MSTFIVRDAECGHRGEEPLVENQPGAADVVVRLDEQYVAELVRLEKECFSSPWEAGDFIAALSAAPFQAFGILREGQLAAYVSIHSVAGEAEILNLATGTSQRRQGLARKLLSHVIQAVCQPGEQLFLEVRQYNEPAQKLYTSLGFERLGRRTKYYADTGEDAFILALTIPDSLSEPEN